jgi:polyphosphate glucokinase
VGIDVGGSGIKGAPVDLGRGVLLGERIRVRTPQPATPERVAETVAEVLEAIDADGPVGVTLPAVVRHGIVETAANIDEAWLGVDATALLAATSRREVTVLNDADAAGIAEVTYGAGRDHPGVVLVVTLGTGIGSALFVDGTLVPNTEFGHLPLRGLAAEKWAADRARERDGLSFKQWAERLQDYFELVEQLLWPDLLIVGGGVSKKAEKFLPRIEIRTPIVPAALENNAGIVGAALCAAR